MVSDSADYIVQKLNATTPCCFCCNFIWNNFFSGRAKRDKITHDIAECELFSVSVLFIQLLYNFSLNSVVCLNIALMSFRRRANNIQNNSTLWVWLSCKIDKNLAVSYLYRWKSCAQNRKLLQVHFNSHLLYSHLWLLLECSIRNVGWSSGTISMELVVRFF